MNVVLKTVGHEILDIDLDQDKLKEQQFSKYTTWAKRWSWISVIILFLFVFLSGILIPVFNSFEGSATDFMNRTLIMVSAFLVLLTFSNLFSLYFRWKAFNMLVDRSDRHYFNLVISILFLLAPIVLVLLVFGL